MKKKLNNTMEELEEYYGKKLSESAQPGVVICGSSLRGFARNFPRSGQNLIEQVDKELTKEKVMTNG